MPGAPKDRPSWARKRSARHERRRHGCKNVSALPIQRHVSVADPRSSRQDFRNSRCQEQGDRHLEPWGLIDGSELARRFEVCEFRAVGDEQRHGAGLPVDGHAGALAPGRGVVARRGSGGGRAGPRVLAPRLFQGHGQVRSAPAPCRGLFASILVLIP